MKGNDMTNETKTRRKRRTPEELLADLELRKEKILARQAKREMKENKSNPLYARLDNIRAMLVKERTAINVDKNGLTNAKQGRVLRKALRERLAITREKLAKEEARLALLESGFPAEVEAAIQRTDELISGVLSGETIEIPADLIPDILRADNDEDSGVDAEDSAYVEMAEAAGAFIEDDDENDN